MVNFQDIFQQVHQVVHCSVTRESIIMQIVLKKTISIYSLIEVAARYNTKQIFLIHARSRLNPIQNGEGKKAPYQFFPCNFYKRRN